MHAFLTALGFRLPSEATLRALGQERALVDLALQGIAVKDEPYRTPLPSTRAEGGQVSHHSVQFLIHTK